MLGRGPGPVSVLVSWVRWWLRCGWRWAGGWCWLDVWWSGLVRLMLRWLDGLLGRWLDGLLGRWLDGMLGRWLDGLLKYWVDGLLGLRRNGLSARLTGTARVGVG